METQSEASAGAAQADRRQPVPPTPGATAFKCGRPVTLLHQTGQGKSTVAQIHADGATPPADRPQWGVSDNGDGAQSGVSLARARALVAPPSLCIFHTAIFRRRMVLARVQDWASWLPQSPLMGGPRVGATSNPLPGFERRGPGSTCPWGPGTFIRTDHRTQQPSIGRRRLGTNVKQARFRWISPFRIRYRVLTLGAWSFFVFRHGGR